MSSISVIVTEEIILLINRSSSIKISCFSSHGYIIMKIHAIPYKQRVNNDNPTSVAHRGCDLSSENEDYNYHNINVCQIRVRQIREGDTRGINM